MKNKHFARARYFRVGSVGMQEDAQLLEKLVEKYAPRVKVGGLVF
jgi:hypothetical protein